MPMMFRFGLASPNIRYWLYICITCLFFSLPNFQTSLHPAILSKVTKIMTIITLNMKCILTFTYLGWKTNSAVDSFVTVVVASEAIAIEPSRISITGCSFLLIPNFMLNCIMGGMIWTTLRLIFNWNSYFMFIIALHITFLNTGTLLLIQDLIQMICTVFKLLLESTFFFYPIMAGNHYLVAICNFFCQHLSGFF